MVHEKNEELLERILKDLLKQTKTWNENLAKILESLEYTSIILESHQRLLLAIHLSLREGEEKIPVFMPERWGG